MVETFSARLAVTRCRPSSWPDCGGGHCPEVGITSSPDPRRTAVPELGRGGAGWQGEDPAVPGTATRGPAPCGRTQGPPGDGVPGAQRTRMGEGGRDGGLAASCSGSSGARPGRGSGCSRSGSEVGCVVAGDLQARVLLSSRRPGGACAEPRGGVRVPPRPPRRAVSPALRPGPRREGRALWCPRPADPGSSPCDGSPAGARAALPVVMTIPASARWWVWAAARPAVSSRNFCVTSCDTASANSCKTPARGL